MCFHKVGLDFYSKKALTEQSFDCNCIYLKIANFLRNFWCRVEEGKMPSTSTSRQPESKIKPSFDTLRREHSFKHPSYSKSEYPALQEAMQPHIDSFNAITSDNLLEIAIKDIGKKTVFDHKGNQNGGGGNRLTFWVEGVQLSRPALTSRERISLNRRLYPSEV